MFIINKLGNYKIMTNPKLKIGGIEVKYKPSTINYNLDNSIKDSNTNIECLSSRISFKVKKKTKDEIILSCVSLGRDNKFSLKVNKKDLKHLDFDTIKVNEILAMESKDINETKEGIKINFSTTKLKLIR